MCTCTGHLDTKEDHDWEVTHLVNLFHTTTKVSTSNVSHNRVQRCGDIELVVFLGDDTGPTPLILDLLIVHERYG